MGFKKSISKDNDPYGVAEQTSKTIMELNRIPFRDSELLIITELELLEFANRFIVDEKTSEIKKPEMYEGDSLKYYGQTSHDRFRFRL